MGVCYDCHLALEAEEDERDYPLMGHKWMWIFVGAICLAAAVICTPIIALSGGPWWIGLVMSAYFWIGFGLVGSACIYVENKLESRR